MDAGQAKQALASAVRALSAWPGTGEKISGRYPLPVWILEGRGLGERTCFGCGSYYREAFEVCQRALVGALPDNEDAEPLKNVGLARCNIVKH